MAKSKKRSESSTGPEKTARASRSRGGEGTRATPRPSRRASSGSGAGKGAKVDQTALRRMGQVALLVGMLACAWALATLGSYDPTDPGLSRTGSGPVANVGGPAGAWVADLLLQVLGHTAWIILAVGAALGLRLAGRRSGRVGQWLAGSVWTWAFSVLLSMVVVADPTRPFPAGGLVGLLSLEWLRGVVGPAGAWLVVIAALMAATSWLVHIDWERISARGLGAFERGAPLLGRLGLRAGQRAIGGVSTAALKVREARAERARLRSLEAEWEEENEAEDEVDSFPGLDPLPAGLREEPAVGEIRTPTEDLRERFSAFTPSPLPEIDADMPQDRTQVAEPLLAEVEWQPTEASMARISSSPAGALPLHDPQGPPSWTDRGHVRSTGFEPSVAAHAGLAGGSSGARSQGSWEEESEELPDLQRTRGPVDEVSAWEPKRSSRIPSAEPVDHDVAPPGEEEASGWEDEPFIHPPIAPVAPPPARSRSPRAALTRMGPELTPGNLVSGGHADAGMAVVEVAVNTAFELPHLGLLDFHLRDVAKVDEAELRALGQTLEEKLGDFGVKGSVKAIRPGPVITTFEYLPAAGIKISKIASLSDDIAMALKALRVRIVAPLPGKGVVGIEIPNKTRQTVWIRDLLASEEFRKGEALLPLALGKNVEGRPVVTDLAKMPHLLVGGTTGSGKSVGINTMLLSLLFTRTPEELRLILIDPKMLEFELYRDIPHLLHPVVTEPKLASAALKWACEEMDERYRLIAHWKTRNLSSYNDRVEEEMKDWTVEKARFFFPDEWIDDGDPLPIPRKLPYLLIVIDELADLMMVAAKDVEESIIRIAQKARAAGIHLIVATQRPSVNVITGLIKANMPSRIAFQVRTKVDGRTILDQNGAENLLGKGDMLYLPPGVSGLERLHGPFVSDEEVRKATDFLRKQGPPQYEAEIKTEDEVDGGAVSADDFDEFYDEAVAFICEQGKASTSMVQRRFKIGYNRAARIIEIMEQEGVVGPADGARPRKVLVPGHG